MFSKGLIFLDFNLQAAIGLLQRRKKQRKKQNLRFVLKASKLLCPVASLSISTSLALIHTSSFEQIENVCKNISSLETKCVVDLVGSEAEEEAEVFSTLGKS